MTIVDWRDLSVAEVAPLYAAERERWLARLSWETAANWQIVEQGRIAGHVAGWVARDRRGRAAGWSYGVLQDRWLQIGGLTASRPSVTRALLDAALASTEASIADGIACFAPADAPGIVSALERLRFPCAQAIYLAADPGAVTSPALSPRLRLTGLADTDLGAVVRLLADAYREQPAAAWFAPEGRLDQWARYVGQLLQTPGCGTFDHRASFLLREPGAEGPRGVVLTSRLAPSTAHILQIAVAPEARGRAHGRALLDAACASAAAGGASLVTLMVDEGNTEARALYASAGFVERARFIQARRGARRRLAA